MTTNSRRNQKEKILKKADKDFYFDCPNLTEEQRQQLGHTSYPEKSPEFIRSNYSEQLKKDD